MMQIHRVGAAQTSLGLQKTSGALKKTNQRLKKILEQLSTGRRINRASDDAAGLAVSEELRTRTRGFKMATRNVEDAGSALAIAEGAGREIGGMLQRQRELALQARNDTLTDEQREALDVEYQQLTAEITRSAEGANFNRQDVADGEDLASGDAQIQAGAEAGDTIELPEIAMSAASLNIEGTSIADAASAGQALDRVDSALDALNAQQSTVGATMNRFTSTVNNLSMASINTQAAESVLRDQDMARGLAELTRLRIAQEGGTQAFSRFREISTNHLLGLLQ